MAATSHAMKAGGRIVINASPEPFTNWAASITEDIAVIGGMWIAVRHPWLFLGLLLVFILFTIWLLPKIWGAIKGVFGWIGRLLGGQRTPLAQAPSNSSSSGQDKSGLFDQLERLKQLFDSGALTEEEVTRQTPELLAGGDRDRGGEESGD